VALVFSKQWDETPINYQYMVSVLSFSRSFLATLATSPITASDIKHASFLVDTEYFGIVLLLPSLLSLGQTL